ncbi:MAG: RnfABCDGE type electron transport complex subunit D [Ruminococcaceae bacterium]|nr:RnfABCDGE type electron transport complex subunit D [Oscillospiraceae bacterium]
MDKLKLSPSPHILSKKTVSGIMLDVIIALLPAAVASVLIFGYRSALVIGVCVISAVLSEFLFQKIIKTKVLVGDLSACVTGVLLALNLPVSIPLWQAALGSVFAIVVVKGLFGGIGKNFANPAITARIMMLIAFTGTMTAYTAPLSPDLASTATPLEALKAMGTDLPSLKDMFLGLRGGCLGETCAAALLLGGIYLIARGIISWVTPVCYIGTVFILALIYGGFDYALYQVLAGGLILGAFFMATDYSTTPTRPWGKVIFGIGCGIITAAIRFYGSYPEGVSFSILLMNILTPYIDKWTRPMPIGGNKK